MADVRYVDCLVPPIPFRFDDMGDTPITLDFDNGKNAMIHLGQTAREVREKKGLTLRDAAALLSISHVHLCNIENNRAVASLQLITKMKEVYGIDLMVLTWLRNGDSERLPPSVREAARSLAEAWEQELDEMISEATVEED